MEIRIIEVLLYYVSGLILPIMGKFHDKAKIVKTVKVFLLKYFVLYGT